VIGSTTGWCHTKKFYKRTRSSGWRKSSWQTSHAVNYAKIFERQTLVCHDCKTLLWSLWLLFWRYLGKKTGMITNNAMVIGRKDKYCHSWF